jgi:hypothetical protein
MRQLVGDQGSPLGFASAEFIVPEYDVVPDGVGPRVDRARGRCRSGAGMHLHPAEVAFESRLEEGARGRIERVTGLA